MPSHKYSVLRPGSILASNAAVIAAASVALIIVNGCATADNNERDGGTKIPTVEQLERKQRSEQQLLSEGVLNDDQLPVIQAASDTSIRTEEEVENRVLCLLTLAVKAEQMGEGLTQTIIRRYDLEPHFSPLERQFMSEAGDSEHSHSEGGESEISESEASDGELDNGTAKWRYESAWVLLWSLGLVDELTLPDKRAEVPKMIRLIATRDPETFRADAKLRPLAELLDAADLTYRYHWAAHEDLKTGSRSRVRLIDGVIYERHYALKWLIGDGGKEWDDVDAEI